MRQRLRRKIPHKSRQGANREGLTGMHYFQEEDISVYVGSDSAIERMFSSIHLKIVKGLVTAYSRSKCTVDLGSKCIPSLKCTEMLARVFPTKNDENSCFCLLQSAVNNQKYLSFYRVYLYSHKIDTVKNYKQNGNYINVS